jgi:hypothetical protein
MKKKKKNPTPGRGITITVAAASSFRSDFGWKSSCTGRVAVTPLGLCLIAISDALFFLYLQTKYDAFG